MSTSHVIRRLYSSMSAEKLEALRKFSACDISDALLKLKVPKAGFIPNLRLYNPTPNTSKRTYAPVTTVLFAPKSHTSETYLGLAKNTNIPPSTHYVDSTPGPSPSLTSNSTTPPSNQNIEKDAQTPERGDKIVLLSGSPHMTCALLGGIMALRMSINGASGIVVHGRIRDLSELRKMEIPIWALGTSTVGTGEGAKVWAKDVDIDLVISDKHAQGRKDSGDVGGEVETVKVKAGDIVCADAEEEGVVVVPLEHLDAVLDLCPKLTAADEKVVEFVAGGGLVKEAFERFR